MRHRSFLLERVNDVVAAWISCLQAIAQPAYTPHLLPITSAIMFNWAKNAYVPSLLLPAPSQRQGSLHRQPSPYLRLPPHRLTDPSKTQHPHASLPTTAHSTNIPSSTASASPSASTAPRPSNPSHSRACPTPSSPRMTSAGRSWTPPTSRPRPST